MKRIQKEITKSLVRAAAGYARAGLVLTHHASGLSRNPQVAIGNLGIATELLLKALISKRSLLLLFKGLPLDLHCALAAPDAMPASFRTAPFEMELRTSAYKSLGLDEAIATFSVFSPDFKKRFGSHLRFLSRHRNICVHAVHPDFRDYEVDRTAFLFLSLVEFLRKEEPDLVKTIFLGEDDKNKEFLAKFDEERLIRVHKKIEAAGEEAKKITMKLSIDVEEWDWYPIECPVCGSDGVLVGETTSEPDYDHDGLCGFVLSFTGETFECEQCGLNLDDYEEILIAGINPDVDRSDESDQWEEAQQDDLYDEYYER